ncbi:hypothetical protein [Shewanella mangrovisoli]|uniref:hypothetical protein n=1 Tax=Shewanella mangrovisoli TaxID=2864211 RepID=UPI0035B96CEB
MTKIQILLNDAAEVVMPALHDFDVKSFSIKNETLTLFLKERDRAFSVQFIGVEQVVMGGFKEQNIILDLLLLTHTNCSAQELRLSSKRLGLKFHLDSETMHKYKNGDLIYAILYPSVGLDLQVLSKEVHIYQI